jgi:hypothetical protein
LALDNVWRQILGLFFEYYPCYDRVRAAYDLFGLEHTMRRQSVWVLSEILNHIGFGHLVSIVAHIADHSFAHSKPEQDIFEPHLALGRSNEP